MWNDATVRDHLPSLLTAVQTNHPLVHQITNYVTANDCANIVLALGGSPVMADDQAEVQEMVTLASALVINLGTLSSRTSESMLLAGQRANQMGIPVILDPVGVGATSFRTATARRITSEVKLAVVRGNLSEVRSLAGLQSNTRGVDAADEPADGMAVARSLARQLCCVVAITGAQDIVTNGAQTLRINNGHPLMARVTGTGCMASALVGTYCGVTNDYLLATTAALVSIGLAGERAAIAAADSGIGTFKVELFDRIYNLTPARLKEGAKIHVD